jgi:CubicO group peptidase (beta-lactamase class C family)
MFRSFWLMLTLIILASITTADTNKNQEKIASALEQLIKDQRKSSDVVGLGAVVIQQGEAIGPAVSGERKKGSQVALEAQDRWHVGSITKSITATMIARLVERGELSWDSTIKDVFVEVDGLDRGWEKVTLAQLLTHTAGAVANFSLQIRLKRPAEGQERKQARESAVIEILQSKPHYAAGTEFNYSNVGYTIAGVMAERVTGLVWEQLVEREIFKPLQLLTGGFGPPQDRLKDLDQPRGHKRLFGFTVAVADDDDNTPIMGPAGTIHLSLTDLALFANDHLQGALGRGALLKPETYKRLHTPALNRYAYGWVVSARKHLGIGPVYWHTGSNKRWVALIAFMPEIDAVVAVTSNDGNIEKVKQSAWEIFNQLAPLLLAAHGGKGNG